MNVRPDIATLVQLLQHRACCQPDRHAYTLLSEDGSEETSLTYGQLDRQARIIGSRLQRLNAAGERVLLLFPTCAEYITSFFGCLYAGAVPVPAYPPRRLRPEPRIQAIALDAQASIALARASMLPVIGHHVDHLPEMKGLRCLGVSYPELGNDADLWEEPTTATDSLAYIQYTSGSTASPKGVMVSHRNLLDNIVQLQGAFAIDSQDCGVSWLPMYHDMGLIGGILLALYAGGPLALLSPVDFAQRPLRWLQAITRYRATISGGPSFAYQLCVDRITPEERATLDLASWKAAFCGADAIDAEVLERFSETFAPCGFRPEAFTPSYGLAEATLAVSAKTGSSPPKVCTIPRLAPQHSLSSKHPASQQGDQRLVSCGQVLPGLRAVVVDPESLRSRLPEEVGEIWVSGPSIAQGYWNRREETSRIFQAFAPETGEGPFLRTGDLGFLKNGELFITGRLKDVIIIRGINYDPHDIELTAQRSHAALQPGGGAAFSMLEGGEERLVIAHELRRTQRKADGAEIAKAVRHAVAQELELSVYVVALVKPGAIPRTSSGKIQRYVCRTEFAAGRLETIALHRLEEAQQTERLDAGSYVAPRTPVEGALAEICADVLALERIGVQDNFFALGGNSLSGTQVISRVCDLLGVQLPLRSMFETPTVAGLAAKVEQAMSHRPALQIPPIAAVGRDGPLPLSFAQERMWFLYQLDPAGSAYNIPGALRLTGQLDRRAVEQSLHDIVCRHEAFRTTFSTAGGRPVQVISPHPNASLEVFDLRGLPRRQRESRARELIREQARRPFDLEHGPLLRTCLFQMDGKEHILLFNMHHIISDAWSLGLLADEILKLYNAHATGERASLSPLPIQYVDFAVWQTQWLQGEALESLLAYWKKQLADVQALELPTDHPRPVMRSHRGATLSSDLPRDLLDQLKRLSNREGVTLSMTLLAAFQVLLQRYTGQEDIAVAVPIANRNWLAVEGIVGSFVNTLVLRTDLSGDPTVRELLIREREVALGAYAHQDMPYARLIAELQPERDTSRTPLAQVMLNVLNVDMPALRLKDLVATPFEVDRQAAQFDLVVTVAENDFTRHLTIEYSTDLFAVPTIERMLGHFRSLLQGMVADAEQRISSLPMLTEAERHQLLRAWNDTQAVYPKDSTIAQLFEAQAERTPDAPAFLCDGQEISYQALNHRANQLAHYLRTLGVGPEITVAVCLERSLELAVALLGILKAGGAYLPLDPAYPEERLAFMLRDSSALVTLTRESMAGLVSRDETKVVYLDADRASIDSQVTTNANGGANSDSLAYVLYTSGSTGRPKGVLCSYRGAVNHFAWMWSVYPFRPGEICCQRASASFVDSVWEFFGPLLQGVPTVIVPDRVAGDPQQLVRILAANHVTRIVLVPSLLKAILDTHDDLQHRLPELRLWMCGSEPLPVELVRRFHATLPERALWNLYGCTETAAFSTWYDTSQLGVNGRDVPIGRPIANVQAYLLDAHRNPVPIGVPGEIYLGGACPARGYHHKPELTIDRFVADPFSEDPAARLYRTGDLGRYQPEGTIEYLGRRDHQVKIRGFRIELGEIEAVLRQHPAIAQAAVIALEESPSAPGSRPGADRRLAAYLVSANGTSLPVKELRTFLGTRLPVHMIPSTFAFLESLPLNPNGKIDRHALARLDAKGRQERPDLVAPQSEIERRLVQIWEEVLDMEPISIRDSFFELGGHSLMAIRLFAWIQQTLGVELPIATLFQAPTVEQLAEAVRQASGTPAWSALVPIQRGGSRAPLFCVHGVGGGVWGYAELARLLGAEQPVFGLQARGVDGEDPPHTRVEDMAATYVEAVRSVQAQGPYCLGGYSAGGVVAFEVARLLQAEGEQVALLALFDTYAPLVPGAPKHRGRLRALTGFLRNLPYWLRDLGRREDSRSRLLARLRFAAKAWLPRQDDRQSPGRDIVAVNLLGNAQGIPEERLRLVQAHLQALDGYRPQVYAGKITLFRVRGMRLFRAEAADLGWGQLTTGGVEIHMIAGAHYNILEKPAVDTLAEELKASLARATVSGGSPSP